MASAAARRQAKRVPSRTYFPTTGPATVRDACEFLGIGRTKLHELTHVSKDIPHEKEGAKVLYEWADLWAHREKRKRNT
jgi:hypothetical protein